MSRRHLTVREMIAALEKMPQDAQVFCYDAMEEADCRIVNEPKVFTRDQFIHIEDDEGYIIEKNYPYYCQGDSEVMWYFTENPDVDEVVIFGDFDLL